MVSEDYRPARLRAARLLAVSAVSWLYPHNALGWLATAAIRQAIRLVQRERRDDPLLAIPHPTATIEVTVTAHEALEAMAALPATQREVLTLAVAGFSAPEIAARTGLHVEAVFGRLRRARAQLRKALR